MDHYLFLFGDAMELLMNLFHAHELILPSSFFMSETTVFTLDSD